MVLQVWDSRVARRKIGFTKGPGGGAWRGHTPSNMHERNSGKVFPDSFIAEVVSPPGVQICILKGLGTALTDPRQRLAPPSGRKARVWRGGGLAPHTEIARTCIGNGLTWDFSHRFCPLTFGPNCFGDTGSKGPRRRTRGSALGAQSMKARPEVRRRMPT